MHVARRLEGLTRSLQESKVKGVLVHKAQGRQAPLTPSSLGARTAFLSCPLHLR